LLRRTQKVGRLSELAVDTPRARVELLGGFEFRYDGEAVLLPLSSQRVLAFLALQDHAVSRTHVASRLWLDSTDEHSTGSLRSALWRLRRTGFELVVAAGQRLRIAPDVSVDVREAGAWAHAILDGNAEANVNDLGRAPFLGELLPDWYDDWVLFERERLRELRVHALECLCERLTADGRFAEAMEAAQAAVKLEPLRESAHRLLITVHLTQGNQAEAVRHYRLYQRLLRHELGLDPSPQMGEVVGALIPQ
jgi:DNA-binding SARP family transcriptional activator